MHRDNLIPQMSALRAPIDGSALEAAAGVLASGDLASAATSGQAAALAWIAQPWCLLRRSLRAQALLIAIALIYVGVGWLAPLLFSLPVTYAPDLYSLSSKLLAITAAFLIAAACAYLIYILVAVRPARPLRYFGATLLNRIMTVERLCIALPVLLLLPVIISTFTYLKVAIPYIRPFDFDPLFAEWDWILHDGHHPWQLLQHVLGHPFVTTVINFFYQLWFFVMWGVLLWQSFSLSRPRLRMRYLITFVLLWALLGNVAATLLSSAGPVYYGRVTGLTDPFAPLMGYLHQASTIGWVPALGVQEMLWQSYIAKDLRIGFGISAMPSLHVATSFSFALLGFAINRWLGITFAAFCALILVGSVHLGWHYAIDGYVAIIATWAIWWTVGRLLDRPLVCRLLWGNSRHPTDRY